jgi:endoglucanase
MNRTFHSIIIFSLLFTLFNGLSIACTSSPIEIFEADTIPDQQDFRSAEEINRILGKGVNLGNALEAPTEGEWGMTIEKEYFKLIKDAGFQSVRIPIRWSAHTNSNSPYKIDAGFMERVDQVVGWALDQNLAVMMNIHHFNELMNEPNQHKQKFLSIWNQVARHFKDHPELVVFEVLNEPHSNLETDLWNSFLQDAINTIRESNPNRVLVAGTAPWGGFDGIRSLNLPEADRQIIVTVHYYNPFQFTHQGAEWVEDNSDSWLGTTWTATEDQINDVNSDFDAVELWSEQNDRPVHVGEFGAYSRAPESSRNIWTKYIRTAADERNFSWAYWEFGAGFGVYDRENEVWRSGLLDALINED